MSSIIFLTLQKGVGFARKLENDAPRLSWQKKKADRADFRFLKFAAGRVTIQNTIC